MLNIIMNRINSVIVFSVYLLIFIGFNLYPCNAYDGVNVLQHTGTNGTISSNLYSTAASNNNCRSERLAIYKVVLHTYWTRELFPKHYPDWRPPAQWTKTIGRSHDGRYQLFRIGKQATDGMRTFTETGHYDILDQELVTATNNNSVLDEFNIPAIPTGRGRSETKFFVDPKHSLVSLAARIVPSPDWFIGVDSFQLCIDDSWLDTVTVELNPLDAGTDNGFTFTAPNWRTEPQGIIYKITSNYPAHPAGSFFYPQNKRLPPIGSFQFIKIKEYELSEEFNYSEDNRKYEAVLTTKTHLGDEPDNIQMNNELSATIEEERRYETLPSQIPYLTERERMRTKLLARLSSSILFNNSSITTTSYPATTMMAFNDVTKSNSGTIIDSIAESYSLSPLGKRKQHKKRITKVPHDCRVSHWSEWSSCSKDCGIGEMHRYRNILRRPRHGGRPCPPLQESRWCGSARDCASQDNYFKW